MLALLPLLVFLLTVLVGIGRVGPKQAPAGRRTALFLAAAAWGTWLALSSEALSALNQLTPAGLMAAWLLAAALLGLPASRRAVVSGARVAWAEINALRTWDAFEKLLLGGLILEALLLLAVAWAAPPNTNDAMQYHLARVMHWLQNGSLAHYPAAVERQLWQPPWAELVILNLLGLGGSDRWANLVQWGAFLGTWLGASGLAALMGAGRKGQLLVAWTCATLPMGILQATGSQNDLVTSFWLMGVLLLTVKAHQGSTQVAEGKFAGLRLTEWAGLSAMVALGLLTKGTFAVFVLPVLAWLLVSALRAIHKSPTGGWRRLTIAVMIGAGLVLLINGPHWMRNIQTYRNPFGPVEAQAALSNQPVGAAALYTNLLRNTARQIALPWPLYNSALKRAVQELHALAGMGVTEQNFTHAPDGQEFSVRFSEKNEELAGNPLHFGVVSAALLAGIFSKRRNPAQLALGLTLTVGYLAFSLLFRWQPWGNRLLLPLFVAGATLLGVWLERWKVPMQWVAAGILLAGALPALLVNTARPVLAWQRPPQEPFSVFTANRGYLQFINAPEYYNPWISLSVELKERAPQCREVGFWVSNGEPEYALWMLLSPTGRERRLEFVDLTNPVGVEVAGVDYPLGEFYPCAVLSSRFDYNESIPGYSLVATHSGSSLYLRNDK